MSKLSSAALLGVVIFVFHSRIAASKQFTKCELADLFQTKYRLEPVAEWVCIAEQESQLLTSFRSNDTKKCGLFGIDSKSWCNSGEDVLNTVSNTNHCRIDCKALIDDDISDDIECAKQIHTISGFKNWEEAWTKCKSADLSKYLMECDAANDLITAESNNIPEKTGPASRASRELKLGPSRNDSNDCCTRTVKQDELDKIELEFGGAVLRVIEIERTVLSLEKAITEHIEKEQTLTELTESLELRLKENESKLEGSTKELELIRTQMAEMMEQLQNLLIPNPSQQFTPPATLPTAQQSQQTRSGAPAPAQPVGLGLGSLLKNTVHNVLALKPLK